MQSVTYLAVEPSEGELLAEHEVDLSAVVVVDSSKLNRDVSAADDSQLLGALGQGQNLHSTRQPVKTLSTREDPSGTAQNLPRMSNRAQALHFGGTGEC